MSRGGVGSGGVSGSVEEAILKEDPTSALDELSTAARGVGIPTPLKTIVIKARAMILRWAVARVKKGRLVRQSTQVRQTVVTHQVTKRREMGREREGAATTVWRSLSTEIGSGDLFIGLDLRSCNNSR